MLLSCVKAPRLTACPVPSPQATEGCGPFRHGSRRIWEENTRGDQEVGAQVVRREMRHGRKVVSHILFLLLFPHTTKPAETPSISAPHTNPHRQSHPAQRPTATSETPTPGSRPPHWHRWGRRNVASSNTGVSVTTTTWQPNASVATMTTS